MRAIFWFCFPKFFLLVRVKAWRVWSRLLARVKKERYWSLLRSWNNIWPLWCKSICRYIICESKRSPIFCLARLWRCGLWCFWFQIRFLRYPYWYYNIRSWVGCWGYFDGYCSDVREGNLNALWIWIYWNDFLISQES